MKINGWHNDNKYLYVLDKINYNNVFNVKNRWDLFKGVIIPEEVYNDENYPIIESFCQQQGLNIILTKEVPLHELRELL